MSIEKNLRSHLAYCEKRIEQIKGRLKLLPSGKLSIYPNGKYFKYIKLLPDGSHITIRKTDKNTVSELIEKRVLEDELHDIEVEREACLRYIRYKERFVKKLENLYSGSNAEYIRLLQANYIPADEAVHVWISQEYRKNTLHPENLKLSTMAGHKVRSKTERMVANIMYSWGIPYRYEQIHVLGNIDIASDFTILDTMTYKEKIIEVAGMMDDLTYASNFYKKMNTYAQHGWLPDVNLLVLYESREHPLDMNFACARIRQFLHIEV